MLRSETMRTRDRAPFQSKGEKPAKGVSGGDGRERRKWYFRSKNTSKMVSRGREVSRVEYYTRVKGEEDQGGGGPRGGHTSLLGLGQCVGSRQEGVQSEGAPASARHSLPGQARI